MILTITMNPAVDTLYLVDNFNKGKVNRPEKINKTAGAKGLNVSRVAKLLDEEVVATGIIGGSTGNFILKKLKQQSIQSNFLNNDADTRICINIVDKESGSSTEVLEKGPFISKKLQDEFLVMYEKLLAKCDIVTASGSLPQGIESNFYGKLVTIAKAHNKKFILDTSGNTFKQSLASGPYIIKPNNDEISDYIEKDNLNENDYINVIKKFNDMGIEMPLISLGKDGCLAGLSNGVYKFSGQSLEVINTVGSGDSFIAGCAVGLSRNLSEIDTIKLGMACGMANTQFVDTGMVTKDLVTKYYESIKYEKL